MKKFCLKTKILWGFIVVMMSAFTSLGQTMRVDTNDIQSLIDEWNFANNSRNIHSFQKVYANELTYYAQRVSRTRAIAMKQRLFARNPEFRQRIITEIKFTPFSSGVVKCSFTKEVFDQNAWKRSQSYLLVSYEGNRYVIVGESDVRTDRGMRYKEGLCDTLKFEKEPITADTPITAEAPALPQMEHPDSLDEEIVKGPAQDTVRHQPKLADADLLFSDLTAFGSVTIPRSYLFILIGILSIGGLMIFVADSVHASTRKRIARERNIHRRAEHVVRDFRIQSSFEAFVITLFDPLFFRGRKPNPVHAGTGNGTGNDRRPDLVFDYEQKETRIRFAVKCQFYEHASRNEVQLLPRDRQEYLKRFASENGMDLYYILGFGGKPDDPRELFCIPSTDVTSEYMTRAQLAQYSKSGMFHYNRRTERIQ